MAEMDEFCKRTWAAIDELDACVKEQVVQEGEDEGFEYHNRTYTAAMAITGLGLGLDALGDIARCLLDIEKNLEESGENESETKEEWPDTIGGNSDGTFP